MIPSNNTMQIKPLNSLQSMDKQLYKFASYALGKTPTYTSIRNDVKEKGSGFGKGCDLLPVALTSILLTSYVSYTYL